MHDCKAGIVTSKWKCVIPRDAHAPGDKNESRADAIFRLASGETPDKRRKHLESIERLALPETSLETFLEMSLGLLRRLGRREGRSDEWETRVNGLFKSVSPRATWLAVQRRKKSRRRCCSVLASTTVRETRKKRSRVKKTLKVPCH